MLQASSLRFPGLAVVADQLFRKVTADDHGHGHQRRMDGANGLPNEFR